MDAARRWFVTRLSSAMLATPITAHAQQAGKIRRVGFLSGTPVPDLFESLRRGLSEHGWIAGQSITLEERYADDSFERIPALASDLVRRNAEVIVVSGTAMPYLGEAAGSIPVVFIIADDPVSAGYVASLARPGRRMTGLTSLNIDLDGKRLETLKAAIPSITRVAIFSTPHDRSRRHRLAITEQAARSIGLQPTIHDVPSADLLSGAFDGAARAHAGAVMVLGSELFRSWQRQIAELGNKKRMPLVSAWRELPLAGGLMSYGTSVPAMFRRAAAYVDRILKGSNPSDLPVEQATQFELVINLKTAKTLGLTIPPSLLVRADQVIE